MSVFIVDEFLENTEVPPRMVDRNRFPKSRKQFSDFKVNTSNTPGCLLNLLVQYRYQIFKKHPQRTLFSDALSPYCQIKTILLLTFYLRFISSCLSALEYIRYNGCRIFNSNCRLYISNLKLKLSDINKLEQRFDKL